MRSPGRTSATWKRYSTGRSFRQRATRLAAFAALILAAATGIAAAVVLLELRMPARLGSALSGAELDDAAVADLCVYIQKCSHLGAPDLPAQRVQSLVARKASRALDAEAPAASPSRAGLAREAHQMVLSENGGEWKSDFHRSRLERIARVLAMVESVKEADCEGSETRDITIKIPNAELKFSGADYVTQWALPNFYFHVTTAYDILRHNGVELGKMDYLGRR